MIYLLNRQGLPLVRPPPRQQWMRLYLTNLFIFAAGALYLTGLSGS